jgi:bis(5'-nucleosyl)-tetraphosphatase (symmetrical)
MATYCIGDVQGCFDQLLLLVDKINFDGDKDSLWFTGDLVNRGPASLAVLRWVKALGERAIIVLGNHDLHLLAVAYGQAALTKHDTLDEILNAADCAELCAWLRQQPLLHHDAVLGFTMVHAGLPPQWDLAQAKNYAQEVQQALRGDSHREFFAHLYGDQPACWSDTLSGWDRLRLITNYFTRLRFCRPDGALELASKGEATVSPPGYYPWFKLPDRAHKNLPIVFGHWAALAGKTDEPDCYALDTGCVWGKCLTAMRLEDKKYFSVACCEEK